MILLLQYVEWLVGWDSCIFRHKYQCGKKNKQKTEFQVIFEVAFQHLEDDTDLSISNPMLFSFVPNYVKLSKL